MGRRRADERQHRRRGWRERALDGRSPSPRGRSRPVLRCGRHRPDVDRSSVGDGLGGRRPAARGRQDRRRRTSRRRLWPREVPGERGARRELRRERRRHDLDLDRRRDHGSHGAARREGGRGRLQPGLRPGLLLVQARPLPDEWGAGSDLRQRRTRRDGFPDTWEAHPSSISVQPDGSSSSPATRTRTTGTTPSSRWRATGQTAPSTRRSATAERGSTTSGATEVPATARCSSRSGHGCASCKRAARPATASTTWGRSVWRRTVRRFHEARTGSRPIGQSIIPGTTQIDNRCSDCTTEITLPWTVWVYGIPIGLLTPRRTAPSSSALRARQPEQVPSVRCARHDGRPVLGRPELGTPAGSGPGCGALGAGGSRRRVARGNTLAATFVVSRGSPHRDLRRPGGSTTDVGQRSGIQRGGEVGVRFTCWESLS